MTQAAIWELLGGMSVGTLVAWIAVICAIITAASAGTIKLYKLFTKYKQITDENNDIKQLVQKHDNCLHNIEICLKDIRHSLNDQKDVNLRQCRYTIVHTCDEAISKGEISAGKLKSLEEMYEEYTTLFHGNGYVKILMEHVRELPITGKLDD